VSRYVHVVLKATAAHTIPANMRLLPDPLVELARVLGNEVHLGAASGFLNRESAVHNICKNSYFQILEIPTCQK